MMPALVATCVLLAGRVSRLRPPARAATLAGLSAVGCLFSAFPIVSYPHAI